MGFIALKKRWSKECINSGKGWGKQILQKILDTEK